MGPDQSQGLVALKLHGNKREACEKLRSVVRVMCLSVWEIGNGVTNCLEMIYKRTGGGSRDNRACGRFSRAPRPLVETGSRRRLGRQRARTCLMTPNDAGSYTDRDWKIG